MLELLPVPTFRASPKVSSRRDLGQYLHICPVTLWVLSANATNAFVVLIVYVLVAQGFSCV